MTQSYHNLYLAAVAAHPEKSKKNVQQETNVLWKDIKENKKNYNEELNRLKIKATRSKTSLLTYWATRPKPTATSPEVVVVSSSGPSTDQQAPPQLDEIETPPDADNSTADAPAQIKLNEELSQAAKKIADFHIVQRTVGLSNVHKKELNTLINLKQSLEKKMKRLVINQKAQQKQRVKKRKAMEELVQSNPEAAKKLKSKGSVGRPPVPMKATAKGPAVNSDGQFGSLFQNLWLSHVTETKVFDAHCPKLSHITHKCGIRQNFNEECVLFAGFTTLPLKHSTLTRRSVKMPRLLLKTRRSLQILITETRSRQSLQTLILLTLSLGVPTIRILSHLLPHLPEHRETYSTSSTEDMDTTPDWTVCLTLYN